MLLLALASGAGWGWISSRTVGALTASLVLLAGWVAIELRVTDPLIDLRAASRRAVAPFYLASLPIGAAFFGATTATTTFMAAPEHPAGYGFGLDVTALAYVGLATTTAIVLGATAVPRLVPRPRADQGRDVRGTARCQRQPVPQPHDQPQRGQRPVGHDHAGQGLPAGGTAGPTTPASPPRPRQRARMLQQTEQAFAAL